MRRDERPRSSYTLQCAELEDSLPLGELPLRQHSSLATSRADPTTTRIIFRRCTSDRSAFRLCTIQICYTHIQYMHLTTHSAAFRRLKVVVDRRDGARRRNRRGGGDWLDARASGELRHLGGGGAEGVESWRPVGEVGVWCYGGPVVDGWPHRASLRRELASSASAVTPRPPAHRKSPWSIHTFPNLLVVSLQRLIARALLHLHAKLCTGNVRWWWTRSLLGFTVINPTFNELPVATVFLVQA